MQQQRVQERGLIPIIFLFAYPIASILFTVIRVGYLLPFVTLLISAAVMHLSMAFQMTSKAKFSHWGGSMVTAWITLPFPLFILSRGFFPLGSEMLNVSNAVVGFYVFLSWFALIRIAGMRHVLTRKEQTGFWMLYTISGAIVSSFGLARPPSEHWHVLILLPFIALGWFLGNVSKFGPFKRMHYFWLTISLGTFLLAAISIDLKPAGVPGSVFASGYVGLMVMVFSKRTYAILVGKETVKMSPSENRMATSEQTATT